MNNLIYPCLWLDGTAKEAASLYCGVFDNSRITTDSQSVVTFELEGKKFMGLNGGPMFKINPSMSFFVICDNEAEINIKWEMLSQKGMIMMPLDKYPWNEKYGWCQDQYGVCWQLMIRKPGDDVDKIFPCLMFTQSNAGKADEAIRFYTSIFKNSTTGDVNRYEKGEPDVEGRIKHGRFTLDNQLFAILESSGPHSFTFNEGLSIVVECQTQQEIDYFWEKLTTGGKESMCGWLQDRFGLSWQIVPVVLRDLMRDPERTSRVTKAFMQMKKFDIEKLLSA
jgi:predicted 3-demethylubiquinone-9 3-methyltransferase (glyoxalase superfamily)